MNRFTPRYRENIKDFHARTSRYFRNREDIEEIGSTEKKQSTKSEDDEAEEMLHAFYHYLEKNLDEALIRHSKRPSLVVLMLMVASICALILLFHEVYMYGKWVPLESCQSNEEVPVPKICFNCFGPFKSNWLWCVQ